MYSVSVFNNQPFQKSDGSVHNRRENAKDKYRAHDEVEFENLPAVDDKITDTCFGYNVFSHNRADPRHADVDFQHGNEIRERGRDYEFGQNLPFRSAHGF